MVEPAFQSEAVAKRFAAYSDGMRDRLLALRALILETAADTDGVGSIEETLKWNEPAYIAKTGTTIRINTHKQSETQYALYVHCQTDLLDRYRTLYSDTLHFEGNRAILFTDGEALPIDAVRHCIAMALLYHKKN